MSRSERLQREKSSARSEAADRRERTLSVSEAPPPPLQSRLERMLPLRQKDQAGKPFKLDLRMWDMPATPVSSTAEGIVSQKAIAAYEYLLLATAADESLAEKSYEVLDQSIRYQIHMADDRDYERLCDSLKIRGSLQGVEDPNLMSLEYQLVLLQDMLPWEHADCFEDMLGYRDWAERRVYTLVFGLKQALLMFDKDLNQLQDATGKKPQQGHNEQAYIANLAKCRDKVMRVIDGMIDLDLHTTVKDGMRRAHEGELHNVLSELATMSNSVLSALDVYTSDPAINPTGKYSLGVDFALNVGMYEELLMLLFDEDDRHCNRTVIAL